MIPRPDAVRPVASGTVLEAAWWGFVGGVALLVGAALGSGCATSTRFVGLVMGFGTGVLFSAVAFELTREAYDRAGADAVVLGLLAGSLVFFAGDWVSTAAAGTAARARPACRPTRPRWRWCSARCSTASRSRAAIGVSLIGGGGVGVAVVAAVFLSNIPEGLSASVGHEGHRPVDGVHPGALGRGDARVDRCGRARATACSAARPGGDRGRSRRSPPGAILTMLSDTMVPEAVKHAGSLVGLVTVLGFVLAFLLSNA